MHPDGDTAHETKSSSWFLSPGSFYNLPAVNDFIIDILLGSPSGEVNDTLFCCCCLNRLHQRNVSQTWQSVFIFVVSVPSSFRSAV